MDQYGSQFLGNFGMIDLAQCGYAPCNCCSSASYQLYLDHVDRSCLWKVVDALEDLKAMLSKPMSCYLQARKSLSCFIPVLSYLFLAVVCWYWAVGIQIVYHLMKLHYSQGLVLSP